MLVIYYLFKKKKILEKYSYKCLNNNIKIYVLNLL